MTVATKDSVTRQAFEVMREVAAPLFLQKGFIDVSAAFNAATTVPQLREAMSFAARVCVLPPRLVNAWEDIRRALDECDKPGGDYAFANVALYVATNHLVDETANAPLPTEVQ